MTELPPQKIHIGILMICCCCVIVLRPRLTSKVMSGQSVNLTTLFPGRLRPPKWIDQYFLHILLPLTDNCIRESVEGETKVCGWTGS